MTDIVELEELIPLAQFADFIILMIREVDLKNKSRDCLVINLSSRDIFIDKVELQTKFNPFTPIKRDEDTNNYYRSLLHKEIPDEIVIRKLIEFKEVVDKKALSNDQIY